MAQREALGLLMRAEEAFQRCDPKYLEAVDNYAYLCLGESVHLLLCLSCLPARVARECAVRVQIRFFVWRGKVAATIHNGIAAVPGVTL